MRPDIYSAIISSLKPEEDPAYKALDHRIFDEQNSNQMTFCIKNYQHPKGLSTKIHNAIGNFEVKGPLGFGLLPKNTGHHLAFAAGTGVLCFVDLVAELCRLNTGELGLGSSLNSNEKDND